MRGISLTQPWATLMALDAKRVETRSWATSYRGELLIHAAKKFPRDCQELCATEPFLSVLKAAGYTNTKQLPTGAALALTTMSHCLQTDYFSDPLFPAEFQIGEHELAFGDYSDNRCGFVTNSLRRLREPIPCKGALGLWAVPQTVLDLIAAKFAIAKAEAR